MNLRREITWLKVRWRNAPSTSLLFELAFLAAFGIMAAALAGIALRGPIDRALFYQSLDFSHVVQSDSENSDLPSQAASVTVIPRGGDSYVLATDAHDWSKRTPLELSDAPAVQVWGISTEATRLIAPTVIHGEFGAHGVVLDQASAAKADLNVGDQFMLTGPSEDGGLGGCPVQVTGLTRPYVDYFNNYEGVVLLPEGVCVDIAANGTLPNIEFHHDEDPASSDAEIHLAASKNDVVWGSIVRHTILAPGVMVFMVLGIVLWIAALWRVSASDRQRFARTDETIVRLGVPAGVVRRWAVGALLTGTLVAAVVSTLIARELTWKVLGLYLQRDLLVGIVLGLVAIAVVPVSLAYARSASARRQPRNTAARATPAPPKPAPSNPALSNPAPPSPSMMQALRHPKATPATTTTRSPYNYEAHS